MKRAVWLSGCTALIFLLRAIFTYDIVLLNSAKNELYSAINDEEFTCRSAIKSFGKF